MKAADIKVGAVYEMRNWPHLRLCKARVVGRMADGRFVVEPVEVARQDGWSELDLAFFSNQFEKEEA